MTKLEEPEMARAQVPLLAHRPQRVGLRCTKEARLGLGQQLAHKVLLELACIGNALGRCRGDGGLLAPHCQVLSRATWHDQAVSLEGGAQQSARSVAPHT